VNLYAVCRCANFICRCVQLEDTDALFELVGDAIFSFIEHRLSRRVFPNALLSKEDFWSYGSWSRALVFVFMARYLHKKAGTHVVAVNIHVVVITQMLCVTHVVVVNVHVVAITQMLCVTHVVAVNIHVVVVNIHVVVSHVVLNIIVSYTCR
jgi:hypothetical protein